MVGGEAQKKKKKIMMLKNRMIRSSIFPLFTSSKDEKYSLLEVIK